MSDLARFLQATDLDALATYHTALEPLDAIEQEVVIACIVQGINMQAIANLLLYPDVLPDAIRWSTLQRYLNSQRHYPYLTLAAVVGCYHTSPDTLSEAEQAQIAAQLLILLKESKPLIAAWAGVAISLYIPPTGVMTLAECLDYPDTTVRHNVLAALIEVGTPANLLPLLNRVTQTGGLTMETRLFLTQYLNDAKVVRDDSTLDVAALYSSGLAYPLLPRLPSLSEADWA